MKSTETSATMATTTWFQCNPGPFSFCSYCVSRARRVRRGRAWAQEHELVHGPGVDVPCSTTGNALIMRWNFYAKHTRTGELQGPASGGT